MAIQRSEPGRIALTSFADRRDRVRFAAAYADPESGVSTGKGGGYWPTCTGPVSYTGRQAIQNDIAHFKAGLHRGWGDRSRRSSSRPPPDATAGASCSFRAMRTNQR